MKLKQFFCNHWYETITTYSKDDGYRNVTVCIKCGKSLKGGKDMACGKKKKKGK